MAALNSTSVLWYRKSKPLGKVRRRVQDLRVPSSSCFDFIASRPVLDLSHNESARLAADCLLSRGLEGYQEVLRAEGEVDFLSEPEKDYMLRNGRNSSTGCLFRCLLFSAAAVLGNKMKLTHWIKNKMISGWSVCSKWFYALHRRSR